jgi:hypothetical protein
MLVVRRFFQVLWLALAAVLIVPVLGGYFMELAKVRGLYKPPSVRTEAAIHLLLDTVLNPLYLASVGIMCGLALGMGMDAVLLRREAARKGPLEIIFDPDDERFVRVIHGLDGATGEFYSLAIHNAGPNSLRDISLYALNCGFTRTIITQVHLTPAERTVYKAGDVILHHQDVLHPKTPKIVELLELSYNVSTTSTNDILNPVRFTIELTAQDTPALRKEFEYHPTQRPMLRLLG